MGTSSEFIVRRVVINFLANLAKKNLRGVGVVGKCVTKENPKSDLSLDLVGQNLN